MPSKREPLEPVLILLSGLMIFFTAMIFVAEHFFASDGQIFQVISGLLTGISGAFLMRIKPRGPATPDDPHNTVVSSTTQTVSIPPPVEPAAPESKK